LEDIDCGGGFRKCRLFLREERGKLKVSLRGNAIGKVRKKCQQKGVDGNGGNTVDAGIAVEGEPTSVTGGGGGYGGIRRGSNSVI